MKSSTGRALNQTNVPLEEEDVLRFWEWYIAKGGRKYDSTLNENVLAISNVTEVAAENFADDIESPYHRWVL